MTEYKRLAGNTLLFSIATFLSRIFGFVREVVISSIYGLGKTTDAFFLAFTIPNLLRQLLGEGAFHNSFLPIYSEVKKVEDSKGEKAFLNTVFTSLLLVLIILSIIGVLFSPLLIKIFAPGFAKTPDVYYEAVKILRIIFPYILLISLTVFFVGILNAHGQFFFPALTPMWLNVAMIIFPLLLWRKFGIYALAIGVIMGGIFQILFLFYFIKRMGISFSLNFNFRNRYLKQVIILMGPSLLTVIVNQLNVVIDRIFASFLVVGSISALYYSNRLMQFPVGVFGIALSSVFFPTISKSQADGDINGFLTYTSLGIRSIGVLLVPFSFYLILFSYPIVSIVYKHGAFTLQDANMTSFALKYYSIGIFFYSVNNFLNRVFYSLKDGKTPMFINISSVLLNVGLNFLLIPFMSYKGLALATSISGIFNFILLFTFLYGKGYLGTFNEYISSFLRITLTCVIITGVSLLFMNNDNLWYNFIVPSFLFFILYFLILYIIGSPELKTLISSIKRGA